MGMFDSFIGQIKCPNCKQKFSLNGVNAYY